MRHRNLPHEIVQRVRRYDQYKWVATRGVDEESVVHSLPSDLRRDIKRHLCLRLLRNVSFVILSRKILMFFFLKQNQVFVSFWLHVNYCTFYSQESPHVNDTCTQWVAAVTYWGYHSTELHLV